MCYTRRDQRFEVEVRNLRVRGGGPQETRAGRPPGLGGAGEGQAANRKGQGAGRR